MPPLAAAALFGCVILGLLWLDRDPQSPTSKALWIPVFWLLIVASRPVSVWLHFGPLTDPPDMYLEGSPLDRSVYMCLLAAGLIVLVGRGRQVGKLLRANWPILLFFLYCAVSVLWSDYPVVASKRWTKEVGDLVMVLVVLTDSDPRAAIMRLLSRTASLLVPLSILFIKYFPELGRGYVPWSWTPVPIGVSTNKNMLGMVCLILGLGTLWRFLHEFRRRQEGVRRTGPLIAQGVLLVMVMWLFWKADSATSFSCFALAGSLILLTSLFRSARKPAVLHLLILAVLSVSLFAVFIAPDFVSVLGRDATLTGRTEVWNRVLGMTENPLFGTGYESFWLGPRLDSLWRTYWWHPNEAHNGYLEVYINLGWMGVFFLAVLLVRGYRKVAGAFQQDVRAGGLRLAYFVVAVIYNFTEAAFKALHPVWIFFLLVTIALPEAHVPEASDIHGPLGAPHDSADLPPVRIDIYEEVV